MQQHNVTCPYRQLVLLIRLRTGGWMLCRGSDGEGGGVGGLETSTRLAHGTANRDRQTDTFKRLYYYELVN